jgi:hypothetical protein
MQFHRIPADTPVRVCGADILQPFHKYHPILVILKNEPFGERSLYESLGRRG